MNEKQITPNKPDIFDKMAEAWGAPGFTRPEAGRFSGNLIAPKTLANLASKGQGPPFNWYRGRAYYEVDTFVAWLRQWAKGGR